MLTLQNDQIDRLNNFNQRLKNIAKFLSKETADIDRQLKSRVADVNDPIQDFEIGVEVTYILHENESSYLEDEDNILSVREFRGIFKTRNEFDDWSTVEENFGVNNHCWLFHDLYDHEYCDDQIALPIEDILRIGEIFVQIKPRYQYSFKGA